MKFCIALVGMGIAFAVAQEIPADTSSPMVAANQSDSVVARATQPVAGPEEETRNLEKTVVRGVSRAKAAKRQAYNVNAIDMAKLKEKNITVAEVLNQTSGVVVRESGGMGSDTKVALNGMSGNQVRTFVDGLPVDVFGPAMSLGNIPPQSIEMIEVYKGVVPIHLGADALGGAINILTHSRYTPYLDASYALSSYNTHRGTLAGQWVSDSTRAFVRALGFYNQSDNDYEVTVSPRNPNGTYQNPRRVPRFHDAYSAWSAGAEAGVFQRSFADLLSFSYAYGKSHDDVQQGVSMDRVYGMVFTEWDAHTLGVKYRKRDLFLDGLSLTAYGVYNHGFSRSVDTAARIYDWFGDYVPNVVVEKGESDWRKYHRTWKSDAFAGNLHLAYSVGKTGEASFNYAYSHQSVWQDDKLDEFAYKFDHPSLIRNQVYAGAFKQTLFKSWTTTVFAKAYRTSPIYRTYEYWDKQEIVNQTDRLYPGYGLASTVFPWQALQAKFSYERAVRMPEAEELFGDAILQEPNPDLKPEVSHNLNLGFLYSPVFGDIRLSVEGNAYYRGIENLIRENYLGGPKTEFANLTRSTIAGFEGEIGFAYRRLVEARANLTYDEAINTTAYDEFGIKSEVYLDRIPNRPYLYGNALLNLNWHDPAGLPGRISLAFDTRWVHSYFLFWESQGEPGTKFIIPGQMTHAASLVFATAHDRYSLALECDNLADEELYDNFRQQKPGRTFSAKARANF